MKPFFFALALGLLLQGMLTPAVAQKPAEHDWEPRDIINVHDSIAVFRVAYKKKKGEALAFIDKKGDQIGYDILLPDNIQGVAMYKGAAVVFYQIKKKGDDRELHALELELGTGKELGEKVIFSMSSKYYIDFTVERDNTGTFTGVLARTTAYKTKKQDLDEDNLASDNDFETTSEMSLITLGAGLEPREVKLMPAAGWAQCLGEGVNSKGEAFVASSTGDQLTTEKFSSTGAPLGKLSQPFDVEPKSSMQTMVGLDESTGNAVTAYVQYYKHKAKYKTVAVDRFDFTEGKAYAAPETMLDKEYLSSMKLPDDQMAKVSKGIKNEIEWLTPTDILQTKDYVITVKEMDAVLTHQVQSAGTWSTYTDWYFNSALISIYDKQMNLLRSVPIFKGLHTAVPFSSAIGLHLEGDSLYVFTTETAPRKGVHIVENFIECLYTINPGTGSIARQMVRKEEGFKATITSPRYIFWLSNGNCVVNRIFKMTGMITKVRTWFDVSVYDPAPLPDAPAM